MSRRAPDLKLGQLFVLFYSLICIVIVLLVPTRKSAEVVGITVEDPVPHQVIPRVQLVLVPHQCLLREVSLELQKDHRQQALEHPTVRECEELVPPKLLSMIVTSNLVM